MDYNDIELQIIDSKVKKDVKNHKQQPKPMIQKSFYNTFQNLKKNATNLFNENIFTDDHFKLQEVRASPGTNRKITITRLKDILLPGTPLFGEQINQSRSKGAFSNRKLPHNPRFICELFMLPFWHYQTLIEPKTVNQKGFYHVVIWKDGRIIKQTIDDTFYYDQTFKTIYLQFPPFQQTFIWMHILLKVWAKCKGSYSEILHAQPFEFIKTFSYPDWKTINPVLEDVEQLISNLNPIDKGDLMTIAQTKDDPNVGLFGLIPNSASYLITGHEMQFQAVFLKIKSLTGTKWNKLKSSDQTSQPEDQLSVEQNEFIIPIKQFLNLFHLIHVTSNKFLIRQNIYYTRYSLNLDARQSKAKIICFEVISPQVSQSTMEKQPKQSSYMTNVVIYFPPIRAYDLNKARSQTQNQQFVIPYCKVMIGMQSQTTNLQASFVQSMKQKIFQNQDGDFLFGKNVIQYEWIQGTYFKGYDNSCTFLMKLKPGRYYLRFKIQTIRVQYRANINIVSSTLIKITDPKMDKREQQEFLKQILSSKARLQKRNIGYLNPIKKGSWYICNDDFDNIGYGYIVIQTRKSSDYKIDFKVDPKLLREAGYRLKSKKNQNKYTVSLEEGEGYTLILKILDDFDLKQRVWPPPGVEIIRLWRKN